MNINKNMIAITLITIGIFLTPLPLRTIILPIFKINIFVWTGFILLFSYNINDSILRINHTSLLFIIMYVLLSIIFIFVRLNNDTSLTSTIKYYIAMIFPILFMYFMLKFNDFNKIEQILKVWIFSLNISIYFMVACGILDLLFGFGIGTFFASFYNINSLYELVESNRLVSYLGHALFTTEILLIYFVFNYIYQFYFNKKKKSYLYIIVAFIGMALTGSKTGIILLFIGMLFLNFNYKRFKYFLGALVIVFLLYKINVFDIVIERFVKGFASNDLTTGRNSSLFTLFNSGELRFNWFSGHKIGNMNDQLVASLEYPVLRWAYEHGIIISLFISCMIFLYPAAKLLKRKHYILLICLLIIIADVNTYNGLAIARDHMIIYVTCVFLILYISNYLNRKLERNRYEDLLFNN